LKIISIVGPTAVGKTSFALEAARLILQEKKYTGIDLISADSRQVYQGLEIISGADVPDDFISSQDKDLEFSFFQKDKIRLHGVSIVPPEQNWSVGHFQQLAFEVIALAKKQQRLVMIIGGTGLYHEQLLNTDPVLRIKPDEKIRKKAAKLSVEDLQIWLKKINPARFEKMNNSDRHNSRRLVRAIEVSLASLESSQSQLSEQHQQVFVGLKQDLGFIEAKIKERVKKRLSQESIEEVKKLQKETSNWSLPVFSALGFKELASYLMEECSLDECSELWALHELQYARRQLTWWKNKKITWFELGNQEWKQQAFVYILGLC
jgi:tRNA dimethylallyltransferase